MIHIYLDAEFDAVRVAGKFVQAVISVGAVLTNEEGTTLDTFYALIRPEYFKRLNPVVGRMTHLSTEQIKRAPSLEKVMSEFKDWMMAYEQDLEKIQFYSFGPDDRRTLLQNCEFHEIEAAFFAKMKDVQKELSIKVLFDGAVVGPALSLEDLKSVYAIQGEVEHNALNDAKDLMLVHQAYCLGKVQDSTQIEAIMQRKIARQEEIQRRQQERMRQAMIKRFAQLPHQIVLRFYPEVLEQLRALKEWGEPIPYRLRKDMLVDEDGIEIPYDGIHATIDLLMEEVPLCAKLTFEYENQSIVIYVALSYRTATAMEAIIKRCL